MHITMHTGSPNTNIAASRSRNSYKLKDARDLSPVAIVPKVVVAPVVEVKPEPCVITMEELVQQQQQHSSSSNRQCDDDEPDDGASCHSSQSSDSAGPVNMVCNTAYLGHALDLIYARSLPVLLCRNK